LEVTGRTGAGRNKNHAQQEVKMIYCGHSRKQGMAPLYPANELPAAFPWIKDLRI